MGGEIYNIYDRPPKVEGICDNDGGELIQRPDDREEVISQRLHAYEKQTAPLVSVLPAAGLACTKSMHARACEEVQAGHSAGRGQYSRSAVTKMAIQLRSAAELEKMYRAGQVVHEVLNALRAQVRPGMTTMDLEKIAEELIAKGPGKAAFKGYRGYPCVLCTSVNSEIVHGIPSPKRKLREGDIVSIDFGMEVDGYFGDSAVTVPVGKIQPELQKLLDVTRESLDRAIDKMRPGNRLGDVGHAVQSWVEQHGLFGGAGVCGARHRHQDARRTQPSELRRAGTRGAFAGRHGHRRRTDGERGPAGSADARRMGGGNRRWQSFGAFRAHRGGHRERPVDFDPAEGNDRASRGKQL